MKRHIYMLACGATALLAVAATSCSGADGMAGDSLSEPQAIAFSATAPWPEVSRAEAYEVFDTDDAIGVFAFYHKSGTEGAATTYMKNQQVAFDGNDGWDYSPLKYWPADDSDKLSFVAYSPYCPEVSETSESLGKRYTATYDLTLNQDIMAASIGAKTYAESGGKACLQFDHLLAKICFKLVQGKTFPSGASVSSISIGGQHKEATLNITSQTLTADDSETNTTERTLSGSFPIQSSSTAQALESALYIMGGKSQTLPLTVSVGDVTYDVSVAAPAASADSGQTYFEAGKAYLIALTFNGSTDKFTVDIQKWTVELSHTEEEYIIE